MFPILTKPTFIMTLILIVYSTSTLLHIITPLSIIHLLLPIHYDPLSTMTTPHILLIIPFILHSLPSVLSITILHILFIWSNIYSIISVFHCPLHSGIICIELTFIDWSICIIQYTFLSLILHLVLIIYYSTYESMLFSIVLIDYDSLSQSIITELSFHYDSYLITHLSLSIIFTIL